MITPIEIKLRSAENFLDVIFDDGTRASLTAEFLRVESPSAEVQGHGHRQWVGGKKHIVIASIEPVGNYAIRITFSDGHDTGIYSWDILHRLGQEFDQRWPAYLKALAEAGLSRD